MMTEALHMSAGMILMLQLAHVASGIIVCLEAMNKLERTAPLARGLATRARIVALLKVLAWIALALGGAGAVAGPLLDLPAPDLGDVLVIGGFAILIIRTRVREPIDGHHPSSDDLGATTVIHAAEIRRHIERTNAHINPAIDAAADVAEVVRERTKP